MFINGCYKRRKNKKKESASWKDEAYKSQKNERREKAGIVKGPFILIKGRNFNISGLDCFHALMKFTDISCRAVLIRTAVIGDAFMISHISAFAFNSNTFTLWAVLIGFTMGISLAFNVAFNRGLFNHACNCSCFRIFIILYRKLCSVLCWYVISSGV